jgi:DNA-binding CsgD family transcriptional regulator
MTEIQRITRLFSIAGEINNLLPSEQFKTADVPNLLAGAEFIEGIFPSWIVVLCKIHHPEVRYVSKNSGDILSYPSDILLRYTPEEFFDLIHPDERVDVRKCYERMCAVMKQKEYRPENYKFAFHYRLRTLKHTYIPIVDEKNAFLNKSGLYLHFSLIKEIDTKNHFSLPYMNILTKRNLSFKIHEQYVPRENKDVVTAREKDVMRLIKKGMTNKQIAEALFISIHTVRNHRSSLLRKTSSRNAAELINFGERNQMLEQYEG